MTAVLFSFGIASMLLALHPFTTYPLSLWVLRKLKKPAERTSRVSIPVAGGVSICVCAYNEERFIAKKAENLLALKEALPDAELLIYVDGSSDRTAEILEAYKDRIRVVVGPGRRGKTHGMNTLVAMATKPILVFTDANVMIDSSAPSKLLAHFADPEIGCVSGHLQYVNGSVSATSQSGSLYWRIEEFTKRLESDTGSAMGADGSLFAIRRELHQAPPEQIIDDMFVSLSVLCSGYRVVQVTDVRAYEQSVTDAGEEFQRKVRIACQAFNVHRLLWQRLRKLGRLDRYKYVSHKLLRWLVIYFLLAAMISFTLGLVSAGYGHAAGVLLICSVLGSVAGALAWNRTLAQGWNILLAFAGTGLGVYKSFRGVQFQTWDPSASIRKTA
jgi:cellulose synthase/poly-beta-1,6-N-acetylglucosamine synthase-like glycosyltransferase